MISLLTTAPLWLEALIVVGLTTAVAMLAPSLVRHFLTLEKLSNVDEAGEPTSQVWTGVSVGIIGGVLLGLSPTAAFLPARALTDKNAAFRLAAALARGYRDNNSDYCVAYHSLRRWRIRLPSIRDSRGRQRFGPHPRDNLDPLAPWAALNRHSAVPFHAGAGRRFLSADDVRLASFVKRGFGGLRIHEDDSSGLGTHPGLGDARCAACHDGLAESRPWLPTAEIGQANADLSKSFLCPIRSRGRP